MRRGGFGSSGCRIVYGRKRLREIHSDGPEIFSRYVEPAKECLTWHGLGQPLELQPDSAKQDALTARTEYINYECWWRDRHRSRVEELPLTDVSWMVVELCIVDGGSVFH